MGKKKTTIKKLKKLSRNVVFSAVGNNSLHRQWVDSDAVKREYDVVLIHYEKKSPAKDTDVIYDAKNGILNVYRAGMKFILIKEVIEMGILDDYDYYIFMDDDVLTSVEKTNRLFEIAEANKLHFFHPAIEKFNYVHEILFAQENSLMRFVNWTETMSVGMSRKTLKKVLWTFSENRTGYGYPNLWHKLHSYKNGLFCIIDDVEIIHSRGLASSDSYYKKLKDDGKGGLEDAMQEYRDLLKKHKIRAVEQYTTKVYKRPVLTVATIYKMEDAEFLDEMISSIPEWCKVVLLETREAGEGMGKKHGEIDTIEDKGRIRTGVVYYEYEDFSMWRNASMSLVDSDFIFFLDADERLIVHQHDAMMTAIESLYKNDTIGGVYVNIISNYKDANEPEWTCKVNKMVRLIRNNPKFKWTGRCHETIELSIDSAGKKIIPSTFKIDHIGYEFNRGKLAKKMQRNVLIMLSDTESLQRYPFYRDILIRDINNLQKLTEGKIKWEH